MAEYPCTACTHACPCADYPARGACTGIRVRVVRAGSIRVRTSRARTPRARTLRARGFRARTIYGTTCCFSFQTYFWYRTGIPRDKITAALIDASVKAILLYTLYFLLCCARIPVHGRARTGMSARVCAHGTVCAHRSACTDMPLTGDVEAGRARPPARVPPLRGSPCARFPPTFRQQSAIIQSSAIRPDTPAYWTGRCVQDFFTPENE
ncbi:hypothetical protein C8R44DRAFT_737374 [Mycena epipterygia]|nr:hypothetical protein C8R44DRAFT_737374 [Mycena epipterygia]